MADIVVASKMATILGAAQIGGVYQIEQEDKRLCTLLEATSNHGCIYTGAVAPPQNRIVPLISLSQKPYIIISRSYLSSYSSSHLNTSITLKTNVSWVSTLNIDSYPAPGTISYHPRYGKPGEYTIPIVANGTEYTEMGGQVGYYCNGTIRFYSDEGGSALLSITIQYMP